MKIYISGKITGIEKEALKLFADIEQKLKAQGHVVINPFYLPHLHDKKYASYMKEDIKALCDCDGILIMTNHSDSKGSMIEILIAKFLGLEIMYEESCIFK